MKEIERNSNYISYEQNNGIYKSVYTMVNVGDYVGFLHRDFAIKGDEEYILMFEEAYKNDKHVFHVESLVSENGSYLRFIIETYNLERVISSDGLHVLGDTIFVKPDKNDIRGLSKAYNSNMVSDDMLLSDYLKLNPSFYDYEGAEYKSNIPGNRIIDNYIHINEELQKELILKKTSN